MSTLSLQHIHKSYYLGKEEFPVLKGIDLTFDQGDFISILGESGGGKSTLMNIIGGLDRSYDGDVIINGQRQKDKKEKSMDQYRRDTIGFIFQSFNLINYLSVLGNVMTSLQMTKLSHKEQVKRAEELLKQVGLYEHRRKKPAQLSGGQKQRVAIARALASDPDIIIADEPTGALDSQNTKEVLKLLQRIAKSGKTVIVVTHSQEVADTGSRIVRLADGRVIGDERLREPFSQSAPQKEFAARPLKTRDIWKMSFAHFRNAWKQNLMITIGTAIGLFSVMFFLGLGNGATNYMNSFIDGIANPKAFQVFKPDQSSMSEQDATDVAKVKHVTKVEKGYMSPAFQVTLKGQEANAKTQSSQTEQEGPNNLITKNATLLADSISNKQYPKTGEIVLSETQAKHLVGKSFQKIVGKTVTLTLPLGDKGMLKQDLTVSGTSASYNMVNYSDLQDAASKNNIDFEPNFVTASVDDLNNTKAAQKAVRNLKNNGQNRFRVASIGDILDSIVQVTYIVSVVLALIAGISLLVSILMIIATTYMSVSERTKEIGILRAMGARRKDIRRLFVNESLLLGISANILAIITAFLAQIAVNKLVYGTIKSEIIQISPTAVIVTVIIGILIALIASIAPASKAARLNPIEALAAE
ncbi:ATP-binding cassette domain-containing protein [Streptococcus hyovaginalis]|uniref:ABC transporter ATP-binding protein/permease n=1 Tax=Streptococcus hyovaginalis TaxID=149015 RepID=UPI002A7F8A39|nr:ATP-binding cassette domain-containing protein [Streptococcus hyovaginalis]MDY4510926.1 ATP-binding cassette domain-containing protein [Streptococcus hyovaginalis]